jgi:DNA-binding transcriptional regulator YiaG
MWSVNRIVRSPIMKTGYRSEALQVIHEDMKGMYELGIINEAKMKEYDKMCLVREPETLIKKNGKIPR